CSKVSVVESRVQVEISVVGFLDRLGCIGEPLAILSLSFPFVQRVGSDIDESNDVRVVARYGNNRAAITMAHEDRRSVLHRKHSLDRRDVIANGGERMLGD